MPTTSCLGTDVAAKSNFLTSSHGSRARVGFMRPRSSSERTEELKPCPKTPTLKKSRSRPFSTLGAYARARPSAWISAASPRGGGHCPYAQICRRGPNRCGGPRYRRPLGNCPIACKKASRIIRGLAFDDSPPNLTRGKRQSSPAAMTPQAQQRGTSPDARQPRLTSR